MNWEEFLTDQHIDFVTRGPNTKRGEVSVRCPWCGEDDPSHHLGISLNREAWGCHRNPSHRGKHPLRLVQALLGCSQAQAKLILAQYDRADPETLDQAIAALQGLNHTLEAPRAAGGHEKLRLLPEFKAINGTGPTKRFYDYLIRRGFIDPLQLGTNYGLKCCAVGRWKDRIIIPTYRDKKLLAWTGRAIQKSDVSPRYLSTSEAVKYTIYQEDDIMLGGDILFVTEGPFDALKMDYYGYHHGARATCVFGTSMTVDQISLLREASKKFKKMVLLLDPDAVEVSFNVSEWLPGVIMGQLPLGIEDPGDLLGAEVRNLVRSVA